MPPHPNSRKLLLDSSRKSRPEPHDDDDGLYNVRRVRTSRDAAPPETPSTHMRLRSMARKESASQQADSPHSSSASSLKEYHVEASKSNGFFSRSMFIFAVLVFSIGGFIALNPALITHLKSSNDQYSYTSAPGVAESMSQMSSLDRRPEIDEQIQHDYQRLKSQHENSMEQLKQLHEQLQRLETLRKLEAEVHSQHEADQLRVLNKQISVLSSELRELKVKYGEVNQNLITSSDRNAKMESEVAEKLAQMKMEVEAQNNLARAARFALPPDASAKPIETTISPNLATYQNGARIVKRFTTVGMADEEHWSFWFGKAAASLFPSGRYQPLMGMQTHPAEVVLDERAIRGPGDCFCVRGSAANITLDLGIPIFANKVAIEHAPRQLETHVERAPWKVTVFALRADASGEAMQRAPLSNAELKQFADVAKLEMSSRNPDYQVAAFDFQYPDERAHYASIPTIRAQRFRFHVQARPGTSAVCVYRIVVSGNVSE